VGPRRRVEAVHVGVEPEDCRSVRRRIRAHALEYARAVLERVGADMHLRGIPRRELAVHPDEFGLRERGHGRLRDGWRATIPGSMRCGALEQQDAITGSFPRDTRRL